MSTGALAAIRGGKSTGRVWLNARGTEMTENICPTCNAKFEVRLKMSPRTVNCDNCRKPSIGATPSGFAYLQTDFAPYLEDVIARLDKRLRKENAITEPDQPSGAVEALAADISTRTGLTQAAAVRRLYGYRTAERKLVDSEFADAVLLADNIFIEHTDLVIWPTTRPAAREIVTIRAENQGITLSREEVEARAKLLYEQTVEAVFGGERAAA